jgi:hypothetical protein
MRTPNLTERWLQLLTPLVRLTPTSDNPSGTRAVIDHITFALEAIGFAVDRHGDSVTPVLCARRPGVGTQTIGLAGHYDVEAPGDGWTVPPATITEKGDRIYGRGLGDNLGPLCLRIATLEARSEPTPPLVWVLQGQEEIGSPLAHHVYPTLGLEHVALWLEETGYFESDGSQRLLARHLDAFGERLKDAVVAEACRDGRDVTIHNRHLNKAFGQHRCPFLVHLAADRPYLALGPNDPYTAIHAPDESLPRATVDISARQFDALLTAALP